MSELDLLYTDVEESLRDAVRAALARKTTPAQISALYDGGTVDPTLWPTLATELGVAGLLVPEHLGGAGASAREAATVLEELGRSVAPVPFLTSAVVAATALVSIAGDVDSGVSEGAEARKLASAVAAGAVAALAVPFTAGPTGAAPTVFVSDDGVLSGEVISVAGAVGATVVLVPAEADGAIRLYAVPAEQLRITPVVSLDMSRPIADLDVNGARGTLLARGVIAEEAIRQALEIGAALLASEQVGLAQWCLDTTVEYLGVRRQFGRIVGGFQALKHRLADLFVQVESARAAARYAAATAAAGDPDRSIAASVAQAYCADVAVLAAEECIQLHGGIGMTWEHPAHLYLKRAKANQLGFGTPGAHYARLAGLVDLPAV